MAASQVKPGDRVLRTGQPLAGPAALRQGLETSCKEPDSKYLSLNLSQILNYAVSAQKQPSTRMWLVLIKF